MSRSKGPLYVSRNVSTRCLATLSTASSSPPACARISAREPSPLRNSSEVPGPQYDITASTPGVSASCRVIDWPAWTASTSSTDPPRVSVARMTMLGLPALNRWDRSIAACLDSDEALQKPPPASLSVSWPPYAIAAIRKTSAVAITVFGRETTSRPSRSNTAGAPRSRNHFGRCFQQRGGDVFQQGLGPVL